MAKKKIKEIFGVSQPELSPERQAEIAANKEARLKNEKQQFSNTLLGNIVGKIQGRDPRADTTHIQQAKQAPVLPPMAATNTPASTTATAGQPQIIRDQDTGEITGVTINGRTILASPEEIKALTNKSVEKTKLPEGAVEATQQAQLQQQQQLGAELAPQAGLTPAVTSPSEMQGIDWGQALGAGVANVLPSAVGGAAIGAGGGALVGGVGAVPGAIIGGIGGLITGFLNGVRSNIKNQMSEGLTSRKIALSESEANIRALITDTNKNPQNAAENLEMFNYQMTLIDKEYAALVLETNRNLNKYLSADGTTQLMRYRMFYSVGGTRDYLTGQMQAALLNPNPAKSFITIDDISNPDIEATE